MIGAMSDDPVNFELIEALERLAELKRQGLLTDAEVETVKNRILSAGPAPAGGAANEDESHRPAVDQPAPPPERDEEPEVDLQPPVIEEHNVDEQPLEPEAEDSQSSSRGDTRKPTSTHTSAKDSRTTTAAQAQARFEKQQRKKQQRKKRRRTLRTLIGALALVAIAAIGAVTITNPDSNPSTAVDMILAAIKDRVDGIATSAPTTTTTTTATTTTTTTTTTIPGPRWDFDATFRENTKMLVGAPIDPLFEDVIETFTTTLGAVGYSVRERYWASYVWFSEAFCRTLENAWDQGVDENWSVRKARIQFQGFLDASIKFIQTTDGFRSVSDEEANAIAAVATGSGGCWHVYMDFTDFVND